jgi:hypothetical protein
MEVGRADFIVVTGDSARVFATLINAGPVEIQDTSLTHLLHEAAQLGEFVRSIEVDASKFRAAVGDHSGDECARRLRWPSIRQPELRIGGQIVCGRRNLSSDDRQKLESDIGFRERRPGRRVVL